MAQDDEYAELLLAAEKRGDYKPPKAVPSLVEWTPEVRVLAEVVDGLKALFNLQVAVNSKSGQYKPPDPYQRPVTAIARARERAAWAAHDSLVARVLPRKSKPA